MPQTNPSPIISTVAQLIVAQLATYASPRGGICEAVENESHLVSKLYEGATDERPKIYVLNTGETARGEYAGGDRTDLHRVDRHWLVVVVRGKGFKNMTFTGNGQPGTPGYLEPFTDSVETVRDGIRVLKSISEEFPVDYKRMLPLPQLLPLPVPMAQVFLDCRGIEFDTAADIPAILDGTTA